MPDGIFYLIIAPNVCKPKICYQYTGCERRICFYAQ